MRTIAPKAALSAAMVAAVAVVVTGAAAAPSAYETKVLEASPLVYYRMAETELPTLATLRDSSGRQKHGNYSAVAGVITQGQPSAIATDAADLSVASNGGDAVASVLSPDLPAGDSARTVSAWYKSSTLGLQALVTWGSFGPAEAFGMFAEGDKLWLNVSGTHGYFVAPANLQDDAWHHVAITYDPAATPKYRGYVDGAALALQLPPDFPIDLNTGLATNGAGALVLGNWPPVGHNLVGSLDEVAIYGSALAPDVIRSHYETATGIGCAGSQPADNEAASCVTANVVSQFAVRLDPATIDFGNVVAGGTYPRRQDISVEKNDEQGGYQLSVSRTAFTPSDLSLSITCARQIQGGTPSCIPPISTTGGGLAWDLLVDTTSPITKAPDPPTPIGHRTTGATGTGNLADKWSADLLLQVPAGAVAGRYSAVVTYSAVVLP
jgi:hypothetical protein